MELNSRLICIYGPAATGKTTFATIQAIKTAKLGRKTLYIDTESGFSSVRAKQLGATDEELEKIIIMKIQNFEEQNKIISQFKEIKSKFSLIVLDTIGNHYRTNYQIQRQSLINQLKILNRISKDIPVIINNQVYCTDQQVAGDLISKIATEMIELKTNRTAIFNKGKAIQFKIEEKGIIWLV